MSGMGIWQLDMPSIEDGFRSAWLVKERVKLIDGWKPHVFSKDRWLVTQPVLCKGTIYAEMITGKIRDSMRV